MRRTLVTRTLAVAFLSLVGCADHPAPVERARAATEELLSRGVDAQIAIDSDWGAGYCVTVTLRNTSANPVTSWTVLVNVGDATVTNLWSGRYSASQGTLTVTPSDFNASIAAGGSVSFGFCANSGPSNARPTITGLSVVGGDTSDGGAGGAGSGGTTTGGKATASGGKATASGGKATASGGKATASGGKATASGGAASGGKATASGGKATASGGKATASGGAASGGKATASGGKATASGGAASGGKASTGGTGGTGGWSTGTRNGSLYANRTVFLVSGQNWRSVLPLVPVTTWHAVSDGEYSACNHPYGGASRVCAYPTLIYHSEGTSYDLDSILDFLQRYQATHIRYTGTLPTAVRDVLAASYTLTQFTSPMAHFSSVSQVVLVENSYATALVAAPFASLLSAPLLVAGYTSGIDLTKYKVICVGNPTATCAEKLSVQTVLARYLAATATDRVVLANATDWSDAFTTDPIALERTSGSFSRLYERMSLVAPLLAAAKEQVMLVLNQQRPSADAVDAVLTSQLSALGLSAPQYLTVVAAPHVIPQARYGQYQYRIPVLDNYSQVDGALYGDLDGDYFQDLKVGRVFTHTTSAISAFVSRDLFYDRVAGSNQFATLQSVDSWPGFYTTAYVDRALSSLGWTAHSSLIGQGSSFDPLLYSGQRVLYYEGHGFPGGGLGGFETATFRAQRIWLPATFVSTGAACSTCAFDQPDHQALFCAEMIRRGAIGFFGTVEVASDDSDPAVNFVQRLVKGVDLGTAMRDALNIGYADYVQAYAPFSVLIADPTFHPHWQAASSQELVHASLGALAAEGTSWVAAADVTVDPVTTREVEGVRVFFDTAADIVGGPYYGSDVTFRGYAKAVHQYPDPPDSGGTESSYAQWYVHVVVAVPNPQRRAFLGVRNATRQVGTSAPVDVTAQLSVGTELHAETNAQGVTWVKLPFDLGSGFIGLTTTSLPQVRFHAELLFQ